MSLFSHHGVFMTTMYLKYAHSNSANIARLSLYSLIIVGIACILHILRQKYNQLSCGMKNWASGHS